MRASRDVGRRGPMGVEHVLTVVSPKSGVLPVCLQTNPSNQKECARVQMGGKALDVLAASRQAEEVAQGSNKWMSQVDSLGTVPSNSQRLYTKWTKGSRANQRSTSSNSDTDQRINEVTC
jgi:hypothetical protein